MAETNHRLESVTHGGISPIDGKAYIEGDQVGYEAQALKMIADELGDANINAKKEAVKTMAFVKHLEILNDKVWAERLQKVNIMLDSKIKEMLNIYLEFKQKGIHEQVVQPIYEFITTYNNAIPIYDLVDKYFNFLSHCQSEEMLDKARDEIRNLLPNYIKENYNFNLLFPKYLIHYRTNDFEHVSYYTIWGKDRYYNFHSLSFCEKDDDVRYYSGLEKKGKAKTLDGKSSFDYAGNYNHHQIISLLDINKPVSSLPYKTDLLHKYGNSQIPFKFTNEPFVYEGEHPTDYIQDTLYIDLIDVYNKNLCWTKSFKEDYSSCYIEYLEEILNIASRLTNTMRVELLENTISADFELKKTLDFNKLFSK